MTGPPPPVDPYPTVAELDTYFAGGLRAESWALLTEPQKTAARTEALTQFEMLPWNGTKCDEAQGWQWPRYGVTCNGITASCDTGIPAQLDIAFAELTFALSQNPNTLYGGEPADGRWVKREKLDVLEQEYDLLTSSRGPTALGSDYPMVVQRFPWLADMLKCWANIGPVREIRLHRN